MCEVSGSDHKSCRNLSGMKIEFNTSRIAKPETSQPAGRSSAPAPAGGTSFPTVESLNRQLNGLAEIRSEKVALARDLISNPDYPPNYILDRIATLLALKVTNP